VRVQVSRVDLDGRRIDFRLVREGDELVSRALRDKGVPAGERGQPARKSAKRSARQQRDTDRGSARASPMQALKSAVKKATAKAGKNGKPRKSRR
ncbi:MAG TPA: ribonuclease R, partial [Ottowia sp.]|nr:ribonuclease R [Ottowia sp.]